MPREQALTPESLLPRKDSLDPLRTCRGVTKVGLHCRRALAASPYSIFSDSPERFYCHQHRDQAPSPLLLAQDGDRSPRRRTSTDSLLSRLKIHGSNARTSQRRPSRKAKPKPKQSSSIWSLCCTSSSSEDKDGVLALPPSRPMTQVQRPVPIAGRASSSPQGKTQQLPSGELLTVTPQKLVIRRPTPFPEPNTTLSRPKLPHSPPSSRTQQYLSLIPPHLSPEITSSLLSELAKPTTSTDSPGYIYIYWIAPEDEASRAHAEDVRQVRDLLAPPQNTTPTKGSGRPSMTDQRLSERMQSLALASTSSSDPSRTSSSSGEKRSILIKIGRTSNVARRMAEWKDQCGYPCSLLRFYPSLSSSSTRRKSSSSAPQPSSSDAPALQVPHAKRVERLIHLELADRQVGRACEVCGRTHREWFRIEASRRGWREVDEVVGRWVAWNLREGTG